MRRALPLFVFVAACADGTSTLPVHVDAAAAIQAIEHLRVTVIDARGRMAKEIDVPVPGNAIPPAVDFALRLPADVRGSVHLVVDALAATGGVPLSSVTGDAAVAPSQTAPTLNLTLPPAGNAAVTQLVFLTQPGDTAIGAPIQPAVRVALADAGGAAVTGASGSVTLALGDNPSGATLRGTLSVAAVNGVASFADLTLDADGSGYTLTASSTGLPMVSSAPFNVRAPAWVQASNGIFGGATRVVAAGGNPTVFYAGTRDAGIFRSGNAGGTWSPVQTGLPLASVNGLAVDPGDGNHALAATGAGVYLTTNGGASWTLTYDTSPSSSFIAATFDPADPMIAYATTSKVFKTINGGATWADDSAGLVGGEVRSIQVVGGTAVLSVYNRNDGSGAGGVWRQGAGNWVRDSGWPTTGTSYPNAVATSPSNAQISVCVGDIGTLLTTSGGAGWAQLATSSPNYFRQPTAYSVAFDPSVGTTVYAGAAPDGAGMFGGVYISMDSGTSWGQWNGFIESASPRSIAVDPHSSANVLIALDSGVWKSNTGSWFIASGGLTALPLYALYADGSNVYAGTTLAGVWKTTDAGLDWGPSSGMSPTQITATNGQISTLVADPNAPATIFAGQTQSGVWRSLDGGGTWANVGTSGTGLANTSVNAIAVTAQNSMLLYAATASGLFKSITGGTAWTSGNLPGGVTAVRFDPTSTTVLYALVDNMVQKTVDGSTSWNPMSSGITGSEPLVDLVVDGVTPSTLYLGSQLGAVYKSLDGGASWSPAGTLGGGVRALAAHPTRAGVVYAATSAGLYRTIDGGASWGAFSVGLDTVNTLSVTIDHANPDILYVGTGGGGVYKTKP